MIFAQIKRIISFIYFLTYLFFCSKLTSLPFIKNKYTLFYNEMLSLSPFFYNNCIMSDTYYSGNFITSNKVDILVSNHFNMIDAFLISSIIKSFSDKNVYCIAKKELEKFPLIGIYAKGNLVIDRNLETDRDKIISFINKIEDGILIILPEGSRMNQKNFDKSQEYSTKNNLKKYNNLLYPKMKGLDIVINELHKKDKLGNLIDFTFKVDGLKRFKTSPTAFLSRKIKNTYCDINTYSINEKCINNYDNLKKWILMIWDKKENYLDNYDERMYKRIKYNLKTSTYLLNLIMINILIFYFTNIKNTGLNNKKNIVI